MFGPPSLHVWQVAHLAWDTQERDRVGVGSSLCGEGTATAALSTHAGRSLMTVTRAISTHLEDLGARVRLAIVRTAWSTTFLSHGCLRRRRGCFPEKLCFTYSSRDVSAGGGWAGRHQVSQDSSQREARGCGGPHVFALGAWAQPGFSAPWVCSFSTTTKIRGRCRGLGIWCDPGWYEYVLYTEVIPPARTHALPKPNNAGEGDIVGWSIV